ncbi:MerR family transcriptional regulator [Actinoplanes solisilvae]|uniref:MerR family transcriptional regulator n=1 Tax=Actinoplanes solisilvae TaxID=2486853 RepID=UPI000FDBF563|nr:MerR family transcriptional regulator [Actinoplanes solisilvae]
MTTSAPLSIQEMAQRSGFSEPTLRYYEKTGLLGSVDRDEATGHRRYDDATVARVDALACLRSSGVSVDGLRRYVSLVEQGDDAAVELRQLFTEQAAHVAAEIERLRVRHEYLTLKARMWDARAGGDTDSEEETVERVKDVLQRF